MPAAVLVRGRCLFVTPNQAAEWRSLSMPGEEGAQQGTGSDSHTKAELSPLPALTQAAAVGIQEPKYSSSATLSIQIGKRQPRSLCWPRMPAGPKRHRGKKSAAFRVTDCLLASHSYRCERFSSRGAQGADLSPENRVQENPGETLTRKGTALCRGDSAGGHSWKEGW